MMHPFWIVLADAPLNLRFGLGVTGTDEKEVRRLVERAFGDDVTIGSARPIQTADELDQDHVVPNMGNIFRRGIWFPLGLEHVALND